MRKYKPTVSGISLTEVLIVLAIVGVLAAVIIPNVLGLMSRNTNNPCSDITYNIGWIWDESEPYIPVKLGIPETEFWEVHYPKYAEANIEMVFHSEDCEVWLYYVQEEGEIE